MFRTAAPQAVPDVSGASAQVAHHPSRGMGSVQYPFRLNMYSVPPVEDITVEEFEGWALDRLRGACGAVAATDNSTRRSGDKLRAQPALV